MNANEMVLELIEVRKAKIAHIRYLRNVLRQPEIVKRNAAYMLETGKKMIEDAERQLKELESAQDTLIEWSKDLERLNKRIAQEQNKALIAKYYALLQNVEQSKAILEKEQIPDYVSPLNNSN